jgi:hypothetical protein
MRHSAFLFGAILLFTASAGAQAKVADSVLPASPAPEAAGVLSAANSSPTLALAIAPVAGPVGAPGAAASDSSAPSDPAAQQPTVYGVLQNYNWQLYAGYAFVRFYEVPTITQTMNGLELGIVYYPGGKWIGADGELVAAFGSQAGVTSKFLLAMGGPRFRWLAPRGVELWAHGLVGGTHFLPQTPYGSQSAFAYEVGGGVDLNVHHRRLAYRAEAGMVGTRYFNTYQYSPKVSVGIVFKF